MELSEIASVDNYPNLPNKALYLAGLIKIDSGMTTSAIFEFLELLYTNPIPKKALKKIEQELYSGSIKTAKEILMEHIKKCLICYEILKEPYDLSCKHSFHKTCLRENAIKQLLTTDKISCPVCNSYIENPGDIDQDIIMMINDFILAKKLSERNFQCCPGCNNLFEIANQGIVTCPICLVKFCTLCSKAESGCSCQSYCQACNGCYVGKVCRDCFGSNLFYS
ncbi:hypothetical protein SteCoe_19220 [Stentor coeruleus]|uniref:RING-type domain-containing protein n=1 Tax=Stentor coeruleus TaxID=5963 RepID=A0A1R2BUT7_9CILI|nr:hypothetical protein SteCoe_19220 [Stentor coeruleus]